MTELEKPGSRLRSDSKKITEVPAISLRALYLCLIGALLIIIGVASVVSLGIEYATKHMSGKSIMDTVQGPTIPPARSGVQYD